MVVRIDLNPIQPASANQDEAKSFPDILNLDVVAELALNITFIVMSIILFIPTRYMREIMTRNPLEINFGFGKLIAIMSSTAIILYINVILPFIFYLKNPSLRQTVFKQILGQLK